MMRESCEKRKAGSLDSGNICTAGWSLSGWKEGAMIGGEQNQNELRRCFFLMALNFFRVVFDRMCVANAPERVFYANEYDGSRSLEAEPLRDL